MPRCVLIGGQDARFDLELGGGRVPFAKAAAAVHTLDKAMGEDRLSTLSDRHAAARLADVLEDLDLFHRPVLCRDLKDPRELDLKRLYAFIAATAKPVGTSLTVPAHLAESLAMPHAIAGSEQAWRCTAFHDFVVLFRPAAAQMG